MKLCILIQYLLSSFGQEIVTTLIELLILAGIKLFQVVFDVLIGRFYHLKNSAETVTSNSPKLPKSAEYVVWAAHPIWRVYQTCKGPCIILHLFY